MFASIHPYRLPFREPLRMAFGTLTHREGLLLRLTDDEGRSGYGDAAPLPGMSKESLRDAADDLLRWIDAGSPLSTPSARMAVEGALFELEAQEHPAETSVLFTSARETWIPVNALLLGSPDTWRAQAESCAQEGYKAVKIKIGRYDAHYEGRMVREVFTAVGDALALRLDANQSLSWEEGLSLADGLAGTPIAYFEEPLKHGSRLEAFSRQTGLPIALDESLGHLSPADLAQVPFLKAVVLKPTVLGGLSRVWEFANMARTLGLLPVVSAAFESGVGLRQCASLALAIGDHPAGLDTYRYLAEDVLEPRPSWTGPILPLHAFYSAAPRNSLIPDPA